MLSQVQDAVSVRVAIKKRVERITASINNALKIQITNAVARSPVHEDRIRNIEAKPMSMT